MEKRVKPHINQQPNAKLVSGQEIENLPSFGLNVTSDLAANDLMMKLNGGKVSALGLSNKVNSSQITVPGSNQLPIPSVVSAGQYKNVMIMDNTGQGKQSAYGFKFAAGISPVESTVDVSQIRMVEESTSGGHVHLKGQASNDPVLHVKVNTPYLRFRYMSEKTPSKQKGKKTRPYDSEETDKPALADIQIDNYEGAAKVVAYCVDKDGKLHPYNLFGENCHRGVYVYKFKFRPGKVHRLHKVSITTPKAKEYNQNLKYQLSYLKEAGVLNQEQCDPEGIIDKQIVYVMVKVILDGRNKQVLSQISSPIHNKKKGCEFRIDDVQPVSAPASGGQYYNPNKNRVMLHVTEDTAFPSDVGVKIRQRDSKKKIIWEVEPEEIKTIKQCVVKFVPPPYRDPNTEVDVEVEICLYDKSTKQETDPFKFVYIGSANYSDDLLRRGKKRKTCDEDIFANIPFDPNLETLTQRNVLDKINPMRMTASASSTSTTMENMDTQQADEYTVSDPAGSYTADLMNPVVEATPELEQEVSLRSTRFPNNQTPFTNYIEESRGQQIQEGQGQSIFGSGSSQPVSHPPRPQSTGFSGEPDYLSTSLNQNSVVTSTTSVFSTSQQTATNQVAQGTNQTVSVNSNMKSPQIMSIEDQTVLAQQGLQLPKLGPNQCFALIGGQIYIVNDDEGAFSEPTTNTSNSSSVQNIGQQQVLVQDIPTQQPTSENSAYTTGGSGAHQSLTQASSHAHQTETLKSMSLLSEDLMSVLNSAAQRDEQQQQQQLLLQQLQQQLAQQLQQQQQKQQQQLQEQQLQQQQEQQKLRVVAEALGLDPNSLAQPGAAELLLQYINSVQNEQQRQAMTSGSVVHQGSNLDDDDDIETDGDSNTVIIVVENSDSASGQIRNKSVETEIGNMSNKNIKTEIVSDGEAESTSKIPTLVNEIYEDSASSTSEDGQRNMGKKIDFSFKNGSFGNSEMSDEDDL